MESSVFSFAAKRIKPVMIIISVIILLRGHNEPGGGFIGGLIAASAYILLAMAESPERTYNRLKIKPLTITAIGLSLALMSTVPSWILHNEFLTGVWVELPFFFGEKIKLGTPLLFDIGVYFTVLGFILNVILNLMGVWKWK
ncbi:MAG: MnhB domain-containing protein [Bacteroidota bacterium]